MNGILRILTGLLLVAFCAGCSRDDTGAVNADNADNAEKAPDHVQGRVTNPAGEAEAGVWVIAETIELATTLRKIVVTNDQGRFVLPGVGVSAHRPVGEQRLDRNQCRVGGRLRLGRDRVVERGKPGAPRRRRGKQCQCGKAGECAHPAGPSMVCSICAAVGPGLQDRALI
jgi:hypothetical protein